MLFELREVSDVDCTMDDSGVYVVIHRIVEHLVHKGIAGEVVRIRADLMATGPNLKDATEPFDPNPTTDMPIMSFIGTANNVRKHLIRFLSAYGDMPQDISNEHASYIGYELHRAEVTPNYMQD